jgi:hypothetical protein
MVNVLERKNVRNDGEVRWTLESVHSSYQSASNKLCSLNGLRRIREVKLQ